MRQIVYAFLLAGLIALSGAGLNSCRQNPVVVYDTVYIHDTATVHDTSGCHKDTTTIGDNMLVNGGFDLASDGTHDLSNGEMVGWNVYKGSPQFGAGPAGDGKRGYIQMWGNGDPSLGEGITQTLQHPIVAGHQYQVSCDLAWMNDNPDNFTPYTRVRFIAYDDNGAVMTIGTVQTSNTSWQRFTTASWTAPSNFNHFAAYVEDDNVGENTATWAHLDNVTLTQK